MACFAGLWTFLNKAEIELSPIVKNQIRRKMDWLSNASGIARFELPKCPVCEIPMFIRMAHSPFSGKKFLFEFLLKFFFR